MRTYVRGGGFESSVIRHYVCGWSAGGRRSLQASSSNREWHSRWTE